MDICHESNGGGAHYDGIGQRHHAHPDTHADMLNVIGGMSHEIARFDMIKIRRGQGLQVKKKLISQSFFNFSGRSDQTAPPQIPESAHGDGDSQYVERIRKKSARADGKRGQIVNGPFDDSGNKKLQKIYKNQAGDSGSDNQTILQKIWQDQLERFHISTISQFALKSI